jgi:hypothetical protein
MSDLDSVTQKVKEGINWRGDIRVEIDEEEHELSVRQLRDPEFREVMSMIDRDELDELRNDLPDDMMEEYRELQTKEELEGEEEERLEAIRDDLEESTANLFDVLSEDTFEGIRQAGKYAVEPDEDDMQTAFRERAAEIEREYGIKVQTPEDVEPALQDDIEAMIDNATGLVSFTIGMQALVETVGESEGN